MTYTPRRTDDLEADYAELLDVFERTAAHRDHLAARIAELEAKIRHAGECLTGAFTPPTLDEIRKARGLPPLTGGRS